MYHEHNFPKWVDERIIFPHDVFALTYDFTTFKTSDWTMVTTNSLDCFSNFVLFQTFIDRFFLEVALEREQWEIRKPLWNAWENFQNLT